MESKVAYSWCERGRGGALCHDCHNEKYPPDVQLKKALEDAAQWREKYEATAQELAECRAYAQPLVDAKDHYWKEMVRAQQAEQQLGRENSFLKSIVKQFAAYLAS